MVWNLIVTNCLVIFWVYFRYKKIKMAKEKGKENYKLVLDTSRTLKSVVNQMLLNYYKVIK